MPILTLAVASVITRNGFIDNQGVSSAPCATTHPARVRSPKMFCQFVCAFSMAFSTAYQFDNSASQLRTIRIAVLVVVADWPAKGSDGLEAWAEDRQREQETGNVVGDAAAEEGGHEGWVWDDASGWYYDEDLAAQLLSGGKDGLRTSTSTGSNDGNGTTSEDGESGGESGSGSDSYSDSSEDNVKARGYADGDGGEEAAQKKKRRRKRRRRSLAPRNYPRSKAQRLVDEAEDSVDGARPESLDLSELGMDRVTSRVYRMDCLNKLDLSRNQLYRISPDLAGMENLVDVNLRHNRY